MKISPYSVRVTMPHQPPMDFTAVARGPMAATAAILNLLLSQHPVTQVRQARISCRSGSAA